MNHGGTAVACILALLTGTAAAQSVALTGVMGSRALLVVDGAPPAVFAPGETRQGVTLVEAGDETAVVEVQGQRQSLRVGENPVRMSTAPATGRRIVLEAGGGGHFTGTARINGSTLPFVVDTGASNVVLGVAQAERMGLNYRAGSREMVTTANGATAAYRVRLDSVRVGDVEVYGVDATVVPAGMPFMLLGNSFLGRFEMRQENGRLILQQRY